MLDIKQEIPSILNLRTQAWLKINRVPLNRREGTIPHADSSNWAIGRYFYPASGSNAVALCLEDIQSQVESVNVRLRNESLNSDSYTTEINIQNNGLTVILVNNSFMEHGNQVKLAVITDMPSMLAHILHREQRKLRFIQVYITKHYKDGV